MAVEMQGEGTLEVQRTVDPDGWVRLSLLGELDHASALGLEGQLSELKKSREPARLDLSRLEFIDSSGVRILVVGVRDARRENWQLEIEPKLSWQVQRVFDVLGLDAVLWPGPDGDR